MGVVVRRLLPGVLSAVLLALAFAPALPAYADTTITPQIQLAQDGKPTYEHQSITVTGTVTYTAADGTTQPLAGQDVQVSCPQVCTAFTATTDASGQFTIPVTASSLGLWVTATITATSTVAAASDTLWLVTGNSPVRIVAAVTPGVLASPSQAVTVSGVLQYQGDDGTWRPLPGRTVRISGPNAGQPGSYAAVTTGSDGTFTGTVTVTAEIGGLSQQITLLWGPELETDPIYFQSTVTDLTVTNLIMTEFIDFQATVAADGTVTASAGMFSTGAASETVQIEYSANGTSGWKPLFSRPVTLNGFTWTFHAPLADAFYRAAVLPGADHYGATSTAVEAGRTVTRITGFKVSATKVKAGHSFKITGTLQQNAGGTWKGLSRQQVWILLKPKGSGSWFWYSKPLTSVSGAFSATIKVVKGMPSAWWIPAFQGAIGLYASSPAKAKYVTVG